MQKLTAKEEEVMELMWQLGECAPKDIVAQYPKVVILHLIDLD